MGKKKKRSAVDEVDLLVVGNGLAGLATAVAFSAGSGERRRRVRVVAGPAPGGSAGALQVLLSTEAQRSARDLLDEAMPAGREVANDAACSATSRRWTRMRWKGFGPRLQHRVFVRDELIAALTARARERGVEIVEGGRALSLLFDGDRVAGAVVEHSSHGHRGTVAARVTCLADGGAGPLSRVLIDTARLAEGKKAPVWGALIVENWRRSSADSRLGQVTRSFGWPAPRGLYGAGLVIEGGPRLTLALLVEVGARAPGIDPWALFGSWRRHPAVAGLLEGAERVDRRAGLRPLGGYWSLPRLAADGAVLVGTAGGLFDPWTLEGADLAVLSGSMAGSWLRGAVEEGQCAAPRLMGYDRQVKDSVVGQQLFASRSFAPLVARGGRALSAARLLASLGSHREVDWPAAAAGEVEPAPREEDFASEPTAEARPVWLIDADLCREVCTAERAAPCLRFCPAGVFRAAPSARGVVVDAERCTGCRICVEADPYGVVGLSV